MISPSLANWQELFGDGTDSGPRQRLAVRVVHRGGHPLLILPAHRRAAVAATELYPAQRPLARGIRSLLRVGLAWGLPVPCERLEVTVAAGNPFVAYLASLVPGDGLSVPLLAVHAGNPHVPGRRFVILVFDAGGAPRLVVKTGRGGAAGALIDRERQVLAGLSAALPGVPRLAGGYESATIRALTLGYVAGRSPGAGDWPRLARVLDAWVDPAGGGRIGELATWQTLREACASSALFGRLDRRLAGCQVPAVLHHGDFAPWNIKVPDAGGAPVVLDWERAMRPGMPGWDWFAFVIRPAILVRRLSGAGLVRCVEEFLASPVWRRHADRAGVAGIARDLLLAYLLYQVEVQRPTEGLLPARELLTTLCARWPEL